MPLRDLEFAGSIPQLYEQHLVPLIFEPYADDLAARVASRQPSDVLEVAAGTGVVTRRLARQLPPSTVIVATDLNQSMLEQASAIGTSRPVRWQQADAMQLPFPDGAFDLVVCQFGVMFFPDKAKAFAEARRVSGTGACSSSVPGTGSRRTNLPSRSPARLRKFFPTTRRGSWRERRMAITTRPLSRMTWSREGSRRRLPGRHWRRAAAPLRLLSQR
jgi:SAM-dependent methyltransferase